MARWILLVLAGVMISGAAPLNAETIIEYQDDVYLRDHETVRYAVDLDYGSGTDASIEVLVRGFISPPRVRILDDNHKEIKETRDTDGDWTISPSITAHAPVTRYYVEVDSARPLDEGDFEVTIFVYAEDGNGADADVFFDKYYFDHESGDDSDHYDCTVQSGAGSWPLALIGLFAGGALWFGRRKTVALARVSSSYD